MSLSIVFFNCRGLGGIEKRWDVLNCIKQKKSICLLQDTHLFLLPGKSNAKCTVILFNNNNKYAILHQYSDEDGNLLILEINAFNKYDFMLNIYGPKRDTSNFYCSTSDHLSAFNGEFVIMAGNFNLCRNLH